MSMVEVVFTYAFDGIHVLCPAFLWAIVAVVGFLAVPRSRPSGRIILVGAGLLGGLMSLGYPLAFTVLQLVVLPRVSHSFQPRAQQLFYLAIQSLFIFPWGLLAYGIWRTGRDLAAAVEDDV